MSGCRDHSLSLRWCKGVMILHARPAAFHLQFGFVFCRFMQVRCRCGFLPAGGLICRINGFFRRTGILFGLGQGIHGFRLCIFSGFLPVLRTVFFLQLGFVFRQPFLLLRGHGGILRIHFLHGLSHDLGNQIPRIPFFVCRDHIPGRGLAGRGIDGIFISLRVLIPEFPFL